jgi:hypothetical protein
LHVKSAESYQIPFQKCVKIISAERVKLVVFYFNKNLKKKRAFIWGVFILQKNGGFDEVYEFACGCRPYCCCGLGPCGLF